MRASREVHRAWRFSIVFALSASLMSMGAVMAGDTRLDVSKELYDQRCASCHGNDLEGTIGPSLLDEAWIHGSDDESLWRSIAEGFPDRGMPAWRAMLSEDEIRDLIVLIREKRSAPRPPSVASVSPLPTESIKSELHRFTLETVVTAELDYPWSLAFLPDARMLVTEKLKCRLLVIGRDNAVPVLALQSSGCEEMLGVAIHPQVETKGWIYVSYASRDERGRFWIELMRGCLHGTSWTDSQILLRLQMAGPSFTGRIAFDSSGNVYVAAGLPHAWDNDTAEEGHQVTLEAQDLSQAEGKIFRIRDDGRVPADNPFVGVPGAISAIWTYGHRIPQGLAFDHDTGALWSTEHGPRGGDELNLIRKGRNYGWPLVTYGMAYNGTPISARREEDGMEQPVTYWVPSIAVSSIAFYEGEAFPGWRKNLLVGSLRDQTLYRLVLTDDRVTHREVLVKNLGRIRDIATGPRGLVYLLLNFGDLSSASGAIVRMVPAGEEMSSVKAPTVVTSEQR